MKNKYYTWYFNIIKSRKTLNRERSDEYLEEHHILPKCLFPEYKNTSKNPWNGVLLTPREHFLCHWLLTKCVSNEYYRQKMLWSFDAMRRGALKRNITSYHYAVLKRNRPYFTEEQRAAARIRNSGSNNPHFGKRHSEEAKRKMSEKSKGRTASIETRKKMSESRSGERHWNYGKKHSIETRKKMSEKLKGRGHPNSTETRKRISESNKGRSKTIEHKEKMRMAAQARRVFECNNCRRKIKGESNIIQHERKCIKGELLGT